MREIERTAGARGLAAGAVELDVSPAEDRRARLAVAPGEGVDARHQLGEAERLGQIVVGAEREPLHDVVEAARGSEHEDLRVRALVVEDTADLVAMRAGQVAVEHDDVVRVHARVEQRAVAVAGDVYGHALPAEPAGDRIGDAPLVLCHQHPHAYSSWPGGCW